MAVRTRADHRRHLSLHVGSHGPGGSGISYSIHNDPDREEEIVAKRLEMWLANMTATVEGIKALAEAD